MTVFGVKATCLNCGSDLRLLAGGGPVEANTRISSIVKCVNDGCNREHHFINHLRFINEKEVYA